MTLISKKNNLPINKGVILIAGPSNPYDPAHWHYHVVNPEKGYLLDPNNNITHFDQERMTHYWVGEWRLLPHKKWWKDCSNGLTEDDLMHSGICAGEEDRRFEHWTLKTP